MARHFPREDALSENSECGDGMPYKLASLMAFMNHDLDFVSLSDSCRMPMSWRRVSPLAILPNRRSMLMCSVATISRASMLRPMTCGLADPGVTVGLFYETVQVERPGCQLRG